ncbi:MAG: DUF4185 domain-containing protein, partial [Verrucomicrobiae bacterium]|nr:DUF4185 domain-containing protein [Verrucomicrobiae bacterium]
PASGHSRQSNISISGIFSISLYWLSCCIGLVAANEKNIPDASLPWSELQYQKSSLINGVELDESTRRTEARGSDIWPITWAEDGHQYTSFGDGGGFGGSNSEGRVSMGVSRVEGGPDNYRGYNVWGGKDAENPVQFKGKGTGILCVDGILYMWVAGPGSHTVPRTRIAYSQDHAKTWELADWELTMQDRLFAGVFVNAGKDYADAPDDYVYSCFTRVEPPPEEERNWIHEKPGRVDLARVPRKRILQRSAWEWFAGTGSQGRAQWTENLDKRVATFEDPNGIKVVSLCYQPQLGRYLLLYNPRDSLGNFALFEARHPWGPWYQGTYLKSIPMFMPPEEPWRVSIYHFAPAWWSEDGSEFTLIFNTGDDAWNTIRGRLILGRP